eukprot:6175577-Pleurochrysis_carterae.AAC.4
MAERLRAWVESPSGTLSTDGACAVNRWGAPEHTAHKSIVDGMVAAVQHHLRRWERRKKRRRIRSRPGCVLVKRGVKDDQRATREVGRRRTEERRSDELLKRRGRDAPQCLFSSQSG